VIKINFGLDLIGRALDSTLHFNRSPFYSFFITSVTRANRNMLLKEPAPGLFGFPLYHYVFSILFYLLILHSTQIITNSRESDQQEEITIENLDKTYIVLNILLKKLRAFQNIHFQ
jgi:hypothetical protein